MTARFFAFEGGEAAGKSTQCRRLAERIGAVQTREPGGTALGERIRDLFLDPATGEIDARTEALLMAADRAQHVAEVIRPALDSGRHVVTDRYLYSSVAYQAHARGLDADEVMELSRWATGALVPDLVVLLDLPVDVARNRVAGVAPDRLEAEATGFHEQVRSGFLAQAAAGPDRWVVVDGTRSVDEIARTVWEAVIARFPDLAGDGSP